MANRDRGAERVLFAREDIAIVITGDCFQQANGLRRYSALRGSFVSDGHFFVALLSDSHRKPLKRTAMILLAAVARNKRCKIRVLVGQNEKTPC